MYSSRKKNMETERLKDCSLQRPEGSIKCEASSVLPTKRRHAFEGLVLRVPGRGACGDSDFERTSTLVSKSFKPFWILTGSINPIIRLQEFRSTMGRCVDVSVEIHDHLRYLLDKD